MASLPFQSAFSPPLASLAFSNGPGWTVAYTYDDVTKLLTASARTEITSLFDIYQGSVGVLHAWHHEIQLKFATVQGDAGSIAYTMARDADSTDQTITLVGVLSHTQWNESTDGVTSFDRDEMIMTWPQFTRWVRLLREFVSETQYARVNG